MDGQMNRQMDGGYNIIPRHLSVAGIKMDILNLGSTRIESVYDSGCLVKLLANDWLTNEKLIKKSEIKMSRLMTKPTKWSVHPAFLSLRWAHMSFCWFCHEAAQGMFK